MSHWAGAEKKGVKIEAHFPQLIENTYRKNVNFWPFQDVNENTASYTLLSKMLLKRKVVNAIMNYELRISNWREMALHSAFPLGLLVRIYFGAGKMRVDAWKPIGHILRGRIRRMTERNRAQL